MRDLEHVGLLVFSLGLSFAVSIGLLGLTGSRLDRAAGGAAEDVQHPGQRQAGDSVAGDHRGSRSASLAADRLAGC